MSRNDTVLHPVTDFAELSAIRKELRAAFGSVVTNFNVFPAEAKKWIEEGKLLRLDSPRCVFLLHNAPRVEEVYYFAAATDDVAATAEAMKEGGYGTGRPMVLEEVSREEKSALPLNGIMTLTRMSRNTPSERPEDRRPADGVAIEEASEEDIPEIERILLANFNPVAERIPDIAELSRIASSEGKIFVCRSDKAIAGLMICSFEPSAIHLRYWWTAPEVRGKGVGGSLLNEFFKAGADRRRQFLWVDRDNTNAIEKYSHYGFVQESMFDHIFHINP